jgi:hypothetical protein
MSLFKKLVLGGLLVGLSDVALLKMAKAETGLMDIASLETARAEGKRGVASLGDSALSGYVDIGNNPGGRLIDFAIQTLKWKKSGTRIRFSGRCVSGCTLYLALSPNRLCISPGASFHFHAPYGVSRRGKRVAISYMLRSYPAWVRSWLNQKGGLGSRFVVMDYGYASRFIRSCKVRTVRPN